MKFIKLATLLLAVTLVSCAKVVSNPTPLIIPEPQEMSVYEGVYSLSNVKSIAYSDASLKGAAELLNTILSSSTGKSYTISEATEGDITLSLDSSITNNEGYTLNVDKSGVKIAGKGYGGIIYGVETLRQLLPVEIEVKSENTLGVPFVSISDAPHFAWRGFMLDVSRHFYSPDEVKKILDLMALYKLNTFHWHLTDDQGWRIEIKKYPLLTEKGAWRQFNNQDRGCQARAKDENNPDMEIDPAKIKVIDGDSLYGGFYTQDEIRDIVKYAKNLNIEVIPEIDMPGHFLSAVENYDGVSCFSETGWGTLFSSPVCPGKESALSFCKDIYKEVFDLFPNEYIHLGADEVDKANWEKCPDCQKRMREHKLKDEHELQAWFVKYMERYFNENGKKLIGWDEIIDGGLSPTATVMWWRNWAPKAVPTATAQGNKVIMSPNFTLYFDMQQGKNSLKSVYDYNPILEGLSAEQAKNVVGVQANLWCEWVPSMARAEYMMFPRVWALSEICWSEPNRRDWDNFLVKVVDHYSRFDKIGVNYRPLDLQGFNNTNTFTEPKELEVTTHQKDVVIRYTTDGSFPSATSTKYEGPILVSKSTEFKFRVFRPDGTMGDIVETKVNIEAYSPALTDVKVSGDGLKAKWYDYKGSACAEIESAKYKGEYTTKSIEIPEGVSGNIGLVFEGYIDAPEDGIYTFALTSDDGSMLYIDDKEVIDNDGGHSPREIVGQKALSKGLHKVKALYFDSNGGKLFLKTIDKDGKKVDFPTELFKH